MNKDTYLIFEQYKAVINEQQNLGTLVGATPGGEGGNWGGSLPKLISLLPMGNWQSSSQKRSKVETKSGSVSDHWDGNKISYAADFGLNSTFNSNVQTATKFALDIARKINPAVTSWQPYVGNIFNGNTSDGYRVQIIWQSNVGGNHYDHVHVGVKKASGVSPTSNEGEAQDTVDTSTTTPAGGGEPQNDALGEIKKTAADGLTDMSAERARSALAGTVSTLMGAINKGGK